MKKSFNKYANSVVSYMQCDRKTRARIKEDILELLQERYEETGILDPQMLLGDP